MLALCLMPGTYYAKYNWPRPKIRTLACIIQTLIAIIVEVPNGILGKSGHLDNLGTFGQSQSVHNYIFLSSSLLPCISCNMGRRDLPDVYAQSPRAYTSGKSQLQVICITSSTLKIKIKTHNYIDLLHLYKECKISLMLVDQNNYGLWIKYRVIFSGYV